MYGECAYYDVLEYYFNSTVSDTPLRPYGDRGVPDDVGDCPVKVVSLNTPGWSKINDICYPTENRDETNWLLEEDDDDWRRYKLNDGEIRYELVEDRQKHTMTWNTPIA